MSLQEVNYKNEILNVTMNCYINYKNEIWFRGKEIAETLGNKNTKKAIIDHVPEDDKVKIDFKIKQNSTGPKTGPVAKAPRKRKVLCLWSSTNRLLLGKMIIQDL